MDIVWIFITYVCSINKHMILIYIYVELLHCTVYVNAPVFTLCTSEGTALKGPFAESTDTFCEQDQQNVS